MNQRARTQKQLGAALRRYRKLQNLTQMDLSDRVNKRQATVSKLEIEGSGTIETLFAMLSALELEIVLQPRSTSDSAQLGDIF
jgi:HTH-type transcriptional regulator/antitoxin HipB